MNFSFDFSCKKVLSRIILVGSIFTQSLRYIAIIINWHNKTL